jgi:hypothetical protein
MLVEVQTTLVVALQQVVAEVQVVAVVRLRFPKLVELVEQAQQTL